MAHPAPLRRHDENGNSLNAGAAEDAEGGRPADGIRGSGFGEVGTAPPSAVWRLF